MRVHATCVLGALLAGGCFAGQNDQLYQAAEIDGRLTLRWRQVTKPVGFIADRHQEAPNYEELDVTLPSAQEGEKFTFPCDGVTTRYDHGKWYPCDTRHGVKGTLKILRRLPKEVHARLDLRVWCTAEPRAWLSGICVFEVRPYLPLR
ncbi:MAG TPA: hypothetical protein VFT32_05695 [Candidatus Eisenbacteria bacterium]|nr:hypothetical protein [Candidatus Eisenbacteria bacterium]